MRTLGIIVAVLGAGAGIASPSAMQDDGGIIVTLSTEGCRVRQARLVGFSNAARDYARLRGRCIAVRGWNLGPAIYRTRRDAEIGTASRGAHRPSRIGLYGNEAALAALSSEPRAVVAAGLVGACEVMGEMAGYCHSVSEGGFLILGELRPRR